MQLAVVAEDLKKCPKWAENADNGLLQFQAWINNICKTWAPINSFVQRLPPSSNVIYVIEQWKKFIRIKATGTTINTEQLPGSEIIN